MNKKLIIKNDCLRCSDFYLPDDEEEENIAYCEAYWKDGKGIITIKEGFPEWCPLPNDIEDDPLFDNTDFAHPAFWRGQLSGVHGACKSIENTLDGEDDGSGVVNDERLEKLRRRLLVNITKLNEISKQQDVILEQQAEIIRGLE